MKVISSIVIVAIWTINAASAQQMTYAEAAKEWRNITDYARLPREYALVKRHMAFTDAIVTYFRDGPGIFNVAPDLPNAALDRIYFLSCEDEGFEVLDQETLVLGTMLNSGDEKIVKLAAAYAEGLYTSRIAQGSVMLISKLEKEMDDKARNFYLPGLELALTKLVKYRDLRAGITGVEEYAYYSPSSRKSQMRHFSAKISKLSTFIESTKASAKDGAPATDAPSPK